MDTNDKTNAPDQGPGPGPGESNARAVRNETTAAGRGPGTAGTSGSAQKSGTDQPQSGTKRVRMLRADGDRNTGQVVTVPEAEADHLIESGAAEAVTS